MFFYCGKLLVAAALFCAADRTHSVFANDVAVVTFLLRKYRKVENN